MFKPKGARKFKKRRLSFKYTFILGSCIFMAATVFGLWLINTGVKPYLMAYAEARSKQILAYAFNEGLITKADITDMADDFNPNNPGQNQLIITDHNDKGDITSVTYNAYIQNKWMDHATKNVQKYLRGVEDGSIHVEMPTNVDLKPSKGNNGLVLMVPLGQATNNAFLANLGPKVPIRFEFIGNVKTGMKKDVVQKPINNLWFHADVEVSIEIRVISPFQTKKITATQYIPVADQLIPGDVPFYYAGGSGGSGSSTLTPSIDLP